MAQPELLTQIPPQDWEATPETVRNLLVALFNRLEVQEADSKRTIIRYHELVDKSFLTEISEQEKAEMQQLGDAIDRGNAGFYASATHRLQQVLKSE